jgi:topoisomerase IA-like protein
MGAIPSEEKKHGHEQRKKRNQEVGDNEEGEGVAAGQATYGKYISLVRQPQDHVQESVVGFAWPSDSAD